MRFTERVAIVTGGAGGIGLETAKRLGSEGARVCVADINQQQAEEAARRVLDAGALEAWASRCDVSAEEQGAGDSL